MLYALPTRGLQSILVDSASRVGRAWQQGVPYDGFLKLGDESVKLNLRLRLNVGMEEHNSPHLVNGQCKCIKSEITNKPRWRITIHAYLARRYAMRAITR